MPRHAILPNESGTGTRDKHLLATQVTEMSESEGFNLNPYGEPFNQLIFNLDPRALQRMTAKEGRALGNTGTGLSLIVFLKNNNNNNNNNRVSGWSIQVHTRAGERANLSGV